ncbi:hypothetical protein CcaverHIS002_0300910 [Cutaneotrichosporon cavernicola]|uniref:Amino acid permease/ SLC12A domain-containing protein n=1 Tax=Cutaneotrichosporon cavernicola TaxID=279322 RepID=A0AA48KZ31_9TREE|nr:uncharacterized protein CcaverHIS019_0300890 [Cutaneotrichosporon cavernicola]BEI82223.1 hypothetical protein CcaverHIS002_0300910 [Cutaneotrichosporon cavernicola]BEI90019.1 hypothetical protein CcaverHIS019_0300890 [Cutaneotrichosporon cavernicola]BEI97792.1 hypothetical protein CcaverHIS631_0300910 [Cutaneotrichosporon cavernicola]BEJ05570.1 hypothetical protein CcaverHIS641_0300920 [Cutaneotrichosporon cavernicola]
MSDHEHEKAYHEKSPGAHVEVQAAEDYHDELEHTHVGEHGLKRDLPPRVVTMIAIAGTIGTGLFVGSGVSLTRGGPVGLWLGYTLVGTGVGTMMVSLGEMSCFAPNVGGYVEMATKYVDPAMGFMMGINAFLSCAFGIPTELTAIASLFTYWDHNLNHAAAYITAFMILTILVNIMGVKYYGEIEFFFACLKLSTLIGLMIFALIFNLGGVPTNRTFIGGKFWREEPFNNNYLGIKPQSLSNFLGFWAVFTGAAFAYSTIESVAVMGGEAHNPRKNIAKAIKTTFIRILFIYVIGTLMISLTVNFKDPLLLSEIEKDSGNAGSAPWVIMCRNANVKVLPHIINAVVISSALSSGNEQLYVLSRLLMALARERQLPKMFMRTSKNGIPYMGVGVGALFCCLAYLSVSNGSNQAFIWLSNLSALSALITWSGIGLCFVRFKKACDLQGVDRRKFTYRGWCQPYLAYYTIFLFMLVLITNGFGAWIPTFDVATFFASYITIPVVVICFVGWKIYGKTKFVRIDEIDLSKGPPDALRGTRYDPMMTSHNYSTGISA